LWGNKETNEYEIAFADVKDFFRSNWKFLVLATLAFLVVFIAIILLSPRQYTTRLTMVVTPVPSEFLVAIGQPVVDQSRANNLAVKYLQDADLEGVSISPTYNITTSEIDVVLQSSSYTALQEAKSKLPEIIESNFQEEYKEPLEQAVKVRMATLERQIQAEREVMGLMEQRIKEVSANGSDDLDLAKLEALEGQIANSRAAIDRSEVQIRQLENVQRNLSSLAGELVVAEITGSEGSRSRLLNLMIPLAVIFSFVMAVVAAIVRVVFRRKKSRAK
jgi:hypothetical protein